MSIYEDLAERLSAGRHVVALTGAGISVESGIPDFRSAGGLWSRYDPLEFGHIESFRMNPAKVWGMLLEMDQLLCGAFPNPAHEALAELERRGILQAVITQNVDSLHQRAGSVKVIEFHGHNRTLRCDGCGRRFTRENISLEVLPPRCGCGSPLRPEVVFFGEDIPAEQLEMAMAEVEKCDMMLVIGTSATVAPASYLPLVAKERAAFLLEINPTRTELSCNMSDVHIAESAGKALPAIVAALEAREVS